MLDNFQKRNQVLIVNISELGRVLSIDISTLYISNI